MYFNAKDNNQIMRYRSEWMTKVDDVILEILSEEGARQPSHLRTYIDDTHAGLSLDRNYLGIRCRKLADYGLVVNVGNGVYSLTDEGRAYLDGELDVGTLEADGETDAE